VLVLRPIGAAGAQGRCGSGAASRAGSRPAIGGRSFRRAIPLLLDDPAVDSLLTIFIMRLARIRCEDARPPALVRIATRRPDGSGWCASSPATSKSSSSVSVRITPAAWKSASTTLSEHASAPVWDDATRAPEAERPLLTAGTWSTRAYAVAVDFCGGRVHWHDLAVKAAEGQVVKDCRTDGTGIAARPNDRHRSWFKKGSQCARHSPDKATSMPRISCKKPRNPESPSSPSASSRGFLPTP